MSSQGRNPQHSRANRQEMPAREQAPALLVMGAWVLARSAQIVGRAEDAARGSDGDEKGGVASRKAGTSPLASSPQSSLG